MFNKVLGIALVLITLASLPFSFSVMGGLATISIQPSITKVWGTEEIFAVNITVAEITNLYGWEINLYYDLSILDGIDVSEGSFLEDAGQTFFNFSVTDNYNATRGRIKAFNTLVGQIPGVNGTGVLFTANFKTRNFGVTTLNLEETILADVNSNSIPHTVMVGGVEVVSAVHDVAIKSVSVSANIVVSGQIVEIYITTANLGNKTETFYVATYYNETLIANRRVDALSPQTNIALTFLWNTGLITPNATCVIKAEASEVPEEMDLENNVLVYGTVAIMRGIHDIAVIGVRPARDKAYEGEMINTYVTMENKGNYTETFNVTAYSDSIIIGTQRVENLTYGTTRELTFPWDTKGVAVNKTYIIKAVASAVVGETSLADNTLTDGNVTLYPPGLLSIKVVEVIPCDQLGLPVSSFLVGTMANFKVTLNCTLFGAKNILLTINMHDARGNTIGVVSFQGPVASGATTFMLGLPIPSAAYIGIARVYASALSDWPHLGGTPYCPELSVTFEIRRS